MRARVLTGPAQFVVTCQRRSAMSEPQAVPSDITCHAVQSESLLRAHSCSPKHFSGILDAAVQLRADQRSPPPDKLDSHRLYITTIHIENSEALAQIDSASVPPEPQQESSGAETVTTSAEASMSSLREHRSPDKSLKASLEVEVAASKDEVALLRQQVASVRSSTQQQRWFLADRTMVDRTLFAAP